MNLDVIKKRHSLLYLTSTSWLGAKLKTETRVFVLILIPFVCSFSPRLDAQSGIQNYFAIKYMKVGPGHESHYLQLELDIWKKIHTARIKADVLDGWYLYRVVSPAGESTKYNYLTIEVYDSAEKLAGHFDGYGVDYSKILNPEEIIQALNTPKARAMIYEEVWRSVDEVLNLYEDNIFRYQVFNAMKLRPGVEESEYQRIEQQYWKPMHIKRMRNGGMKGWGLYTMIIPGGTERNYHWATVDFYDNFIDYLKPTDGLMEEIHGKRNAQKYLEETIDKRDLLKTEIRELVDYVNESTIN